MAGRYKTYVPAHTPPNWEKLSLTKKGEHMATCGMAELRMWWWSLEPEQRRKCKDILDSSWKPAAKALDDARSGE